MPKQTDLIKHGSFTIKVNEFVNRGRPLFFFNFYEGRAGISETSPIRRPLMRRPARLPEGWREGTAPPSPSRTRIRDACLHAVRVLEGLDVPLSAAAEEYAAARKKLGGDSLADAVDFYLPEFFPPPQKSVAEVVKEFLAAKTQD